MENQTVIITSPESLMFLYTLYFFSVVILIIALFVQVTWVVPLQIKEVGVKNGLKKLRVLMLLSGLTFTVASIAGVIVLTARFFIPGGDLYRYLSSVLVLIHSTAFLTFALIQRTIYKQQYSTEQKALHDKIDQLESTNR